MSFRARIAIAAAGAVAFAVIVASAVAYVVVREELRAPVVDALQRRADELRSHPIRWIEGPGGKPYLFGVGPGFGEAKPYVQLVLSDGTAILPLDQRFELPVAEDRDRAVHADPTLDDQLLAGTTRAEPRALRHSRPENDRDCRADASPPRSRVRGQRRRR